MIHHILKDGTEIPDIAGYVLKQEDNEALYQVIEQIEERINDEESN